MNKKYKQLAAALRKKYVAERCYISGFNQLEIALTHELNRAGIKHCDRRPTPATHGGYKFTYKLKPFQHLDISIMVDGCGIALGVHVEYREYY